MMIVSVASLRPSRFEFSPNRKSVSGNPCGLCAPFPLPCTPRRTRRAGRKPGRSAGAMPSPAFRYNLGRFWPRLQNRSSLRACVRAYVIYHTHLLFLLLFLFLLLLLLVLCTFVHVRIRSFTFVYVRTDCSRFFRSRSSAISLLRWHLAA